VRLRVGCSRVGMPFSTLAVDGSGVEMAVAGAAAAAGVLTASLAPGVQTVVMVVATGQGEV
jgi:hypothetical protein